MSGTLSYIPYTDQAAETRKNGTVQFTIGSDTVEVGRTSLDFTVHAAYTFPIAAAISTATANSHLMAWMAGSTYDVLLVDAVLKQLVSAGSATVGQFGLFRLTSAGTGGTSLTGAKQDNGDASVGCTCQTLPTVKGTETTLMYTDTGIMLSTAATAGQEDYLDWHWNPYMIKPPRIPAGTSNGMAIKEITAIATGTVAGWIRVLEVSYS